MDKTVMVHHNQFKTYVWPGGHADGEQDLISAALREAQEETGITDIYPLSSDILNVSVFSVPAHTKRGEPMPGHIHYSICYGCIASDRQMLRIKEDENSAVAWLPVESLDEYCDEPEMVPVYARITELMRLLTQGKEGLYWRLPAALLPLSLIHIYFYSERLLY